MRCRYPDLLQIEQLHSDTRISAGARTSNRTRPQWHPPVWRVIAPGGGTGSGITAGEALPFLDFSDVRLVVLMHERRHIAERDGAHAVLRAAAYPGLRRQRPEDPDVGLARGLEDAQACRKRKRTVVAFACGFRSIEVRKTRVRFRLQPPDAKTESLAFEVGQVPDLFHGREGAGRAGRLYFPRRERPECLAKERLHCRERLHQVASLNLCELHVLHVTSLLYSITAGASF